MYNKNIVIKLKKILFIVAILFIAATTWSINNNYPGKVRNVENRLIIFKEVLSLLKNDIGRYPTTEEGLNSLFINTGNIDSWKGPYLNNNVLPTDAWSNDFIYKYIEDNGGVKYIIYSFGKNQINEYGFGDDIGGDEVGIDTMKHY